VIGARRHAVTHLVERHGDAKRPDLLEALTDAPRFDRQASTIVARRDSNGGNERRR
jgi:hypothetical protein